MGKRCDFTNVFPTVVVTSFANRLKFRPGNFPSWKFPLLPSALNQCRQTAKAKVNCNYGVGGWPPSSSGSARRSRGTKISPTKFPTKSREPCSATVECAGSRQRRARARCPFSVLLGQRWRAVRLLRTFQ